MPVGRSKGVVDMSDIHDVMDNDFFKVVFAQFDPDVQDEIRTRGATVRIGNTNKLYKEYHLREHEAEHDEDR